MALVAPDKASRQPTELHTKSWAPLGLTIGDEDIIHHITAIKLRISAGFQGLGTGLRDDLHMACCRHICKCR